MCVAAAEFLGAMDAKSVVPDHPAAASEAKFLLKNQFQLRGVLIADRQPEGTGRLQDAVNLPAPLVRPIQVLVRTGAVVIYVIIIADVERRIGEGEIDRPGVQFFKSCD